MIGPQSLTFMQNKTLDQSGQNGVELHLFEVNEPKIYTYVGRVRLDGNPYQEDQPDKEEKSRKVWIFPLKLTSGEVPVVTAGKYDTHEAKKLRQARRLSNEEIHERAAKARRKVGQRRVMSIRYERDPYVAEDAKRRANGRCELCRSRAPFDGKDGIAYLETHHIKWLSKQGDDSIDNTVALCPNCHRKMHILNLRKDRVKLEAIASEKH